MNHITSNVTEGQIKEAGLSILKFLQDQLLEKNETIEDPKGCNFTNNIWGDNFDFRDTSTHAETHIIGKDFREFLSQYRDINLDISDIKPKELVTVNLKMNNISPEELLVAHEIISQTLKYLILHKYISAEFTEGSQKIFLTEKGLDRADFLK